VELAAACSVCREGEKKIMTKKLLGKTKYLVIIGSILALFFLFGCIGTPLYSPTACFKAAPTIGYAPLTVAFDASCSSANGMSPPATGLFSYVWDFDDGNSNGPTTGMTVNGA